MVEMASKNCSKIIIRLNICAVVIFLCSNSILAVTSDETEPDFSKAEHVIKPRHIRIYSKPPGENLEKQTGIGFRQHLDNALQGGSVGIEFNLKPLRERWSGFMDKARNYLPLLYKLKKNKVKDSDELPSANSPEDSDDLPSANSPEDSDNEEREDPEVDLKPRLDTSEEDNSEDEDDEFSMEFELDPRRTNLNPEEIVLLNPEEIVLLEREKLVENEH